MNPDLATRLEAFAEVIVRVGLNLQPGQRLLIADPYELQGVTRSAAALVDAVRHEAACEVEIIWGAEARLREFAVQADTRGFARLTAANARLMDDYLRRGDALLFLQSSQPALLNGLPDDRLAEMRRIGWESFGPVARQLMQGGTNWTVAPAPIPAWADAVYPDLAADRRCAALWETVFEACRVPRGSATSRRRQGYGGQAGRAQEIPAGGRVPPQGGSIAAWQTHLQMLQQHCSSLNAQRLPTLRYKGEGTDLTVTLPPEHVWCTARLATKSGQAFVANLPTEEVFTAPHRDSAEGTVSVSRPVSYGGTVIEGLELEFKRGRVVSARARTGADQFQRFLETDEGACHLGEVALVPGPTSLATSGRHFFHPLLDENAQNHVALGEGYGFCLRRPDPAALNRSLVHLDLPFSARPDLSAADPT